MPLPTGKSFPLGKLLGWIIIVDVLLAGISSTAGSLALYMGGEAIGAAQPASIGAAVTGWIVNFIVISLVQGFIMGMFGLVIAFIVGTLYKTADEKSAAALNKAFKWGGRGVFLLAGLLALYNGFVQYGLFSAAHADPVMNLVATVLSSIVLFAYVSFGLSFFAIVATIVLSVFYMVLSGGFKRTPLETEKDKPAVEKKDAK